MRIKICGITNLQDALNAIEAGADALGFVFYEKSPRYISPTAATKIIEQLPPFVQTVGLFVNMYAAQVDFIAKLAKVDTVQVHFEPDDNFHTSLQTKYIDVIRVKNKTDLEKLDSSKYYLVDAFVESFGGEGKRIALEYFKELDCSKLILAGGLNENNLQELKGMNFYGVDVSSGVEASKGKKDKQKMINFVKAANEI